MWKFLFFKEFTIFLHMIFIENMTFCDFLNVFICAIDSVGNSFDLFKGNNSPIVYSQLVTRQKILCKLGINLVCQGFCSGILLFAMN